MGGTYQKVSPLDGAGSKGVAELNLDTRNEHKEVRDVFAGEGQGISDEDEYRINDVAMDLNEAHVLEAAVVSHIPVLEKLQHQSSAPIVRWDRFLPLRTLKVLLVENDDSTRQVVSALLRNCCYEVTAVANGLDAWRVLQDLTNRIDLVLTEVVMPGWSGIGLLCKIMSHKTCKTIPVIMMSSNDSMGIVFKCLSKGAVDFLVKPIRKNELKNLWQHVWRRCHSSSGSGSGSESGIEGQKFTKLKSEDDSDNNSGSNDEEDNGSIGLSARDGSDNGSGTQSSWTKRAFEADSPQPMSPSEQLACPHDSTCAHVIHPKTEAFCSNNVPMNAGADWKEQNKITDDIMSTDLRNESYQTDKFSTKLTGPSTEKFPENAPSNMDVIRPMNYNTLNESSAQAPDQRGSSSINTNQQSVFRPLDTSKDFLKISENKDNGYVELPSLELSLKRLRSNSIPSNDERNVLKHSNLSAFSRYPVSVASFQAPTYGANSALNNSSEATPQNHGSNGSSSNNNDKSSTNINVVTKSGIYKEVSTSAFHPVQSQSSTIQTVVQEKIDAAAAAVAAPPAIGQSRGSQKQVQVQHHHHHHHHYHHHVHAMQPQPDQDGLSVENMKANVTYCNSSNVFTIPVEANTANCSNNGSNSGSNHGSDGHNGCSNAGGTNMESAAAMGVAEKSGVGGGDGSGGSGNGAYQSHFAHREAALNKFRQKRKERNFGKKVRYQSRKRLAEQRPRVRGQFVRRIIHEEEGS